MFDCIHFLVVEFFFCIILQALELSQELLDQREVIHVDIAYDELSSGEYKEELVRYIKQCMHKCHMLVSLMLPTHAGLHQV